MNQPLAQPTRNWKNSPLGYGIVVVLLALAGLLLFIRMRPPQTIIEKAYGYYTDDDSKTYFRDVLKVPPFDHGGREAVEAIVIRDPNGQPTVAYMVKYTPEQSAQLNKVLAKCDRYCVYGPGGMLVKKPGGAWLACDGPQAGEARAIRDLRRPDGSLPDILDPNRTP